MAEDRITICIEEAAEAGTKAALPNLAKQAVRKSVEIGCDVLCKNLKTFLSTFAGLLDDPLLVDSSTVIDEVELSLVVTASGGIELVGKLAAGSQAGVKIKLKRRGTERRP